MDLFRRKFLQQSYFICRILTASRPYSHFTQNYILASNLKPVLPTTSFSVRYYAKGKDKKKDSKKPTKVEVNADFLKTYVNYDQILSSMQKNLDTMKDEYIKNLSLRSTTGAIETLIVNTGGEEHELQELAQIVRKNPKTIVVNMINFPQTIPDVLQAIRKSGMNLNPQQDGTTLFIPVPKVTKEHREGLAKNAKSLFIKCRDSIKDVQNNAIKKLKKKDKVPEDDLHSCIAQLGSLADKFIAQAEHLLETKQTELLGGKD
uniref:Ribosome-recycling factor, mitochondrial n=1 Tax=Culicoides sonorensis TaxID=179676 RepID=A0A336MRP8_CULSO